MPPKISIIIPVYNRLDLLQETLDSVINQDFRDWECLLIDDGSEPETLRFLHKICSGDPRFTLLQKDGQPKGASASRNLGWRNTHSDLIMFMDSDDFMPVSCLSARLHFISQYPDNDFWIFATRHFYNTPGDSSYLWNVLHKEQDDLSRFLMHDNPWHTSGPVWTKSTLEKTGGFDEEAICWQDWEWHIRTLMIDPKYVKSEDYHSAVFYRKDLQTDVTSITADRILNMGAQWDIFQKIETRLRNKFSSQALRLPFSITMYRIFEDAISHKKQIIGKKVLRYSRKNGYFSMIERAFLFTLLMASESTNRWLVNKCRRALQRTNPAVFHSKEDQKYIFHLLLFGNS